MSNTLVSVLFVEPVTHIKEVPTLPDVTFIQINTNYAHFDFLLGNSCQGKISVSLSMLGVNLCGICSIVIDR